MTKKVRHIPLILSRHPKAPPLRPRIDGAGFRTDEWKLRALAWIASFALAAVLGLAAAYVTAAAEKSEYRLEPNDILMITVHGQPDLTTRARVAKEGDITFPLVGKIEAKGLTAQELELKLKGLLEKSYLVNAQVLVFIEEYSLLQVSVIGEVEKPGKYSINRDKNMTVTDAIAMAGGFTKHADINKTKVIRTKNGKEETVLVRVKDIIDKGNKDKDVLLEQDDIVSVPESFF